MRFLLLCLMLFVSACARGSAETTTQTPLSPLQPVSQSLVTLRRSPTQTETSPVPVARASSAPGATSEALPVIALAEPPVPETSAEVQLAATSARPVPPAVCTQSCQLEAELARDLPLDQQIWFGAHNAYNYEGIFKNQHWNLTQQLEAGARVLELDLHRSLFSARVRVCHGIGAVNCLLNPFGIQNYRKLLTEIKNWSEQHPDQLLIIELENHVDQASEVEGPLREIFGAVLYTAAERPVNWAQETPRQLTARGKRVIVADFGPLRFDGQLIWNENELFTNTPSGQFTPDCKVQGQPMGEKAWGFYDDKAFGKPNPITPTTLPHYLRCGARYLKLDQLTPELLAARHFSWPQPSRDCALLTPAQRWQSAPCEQPRRVACQAPPTRWQLTAEPHTFLEAPEACRKDFGNEYQFALPRNWLQNQALQNLIPAGTSVWIHLQTGT